MDEFPAWLQNAALMSIPAFFPLALMIYWLWRVRIGRLMGGPTLRQTSRSRSGSAQLPSTFG